jgi:hypothetical protein
MYHNLPPKPNHQLNKTPIQYPHNSCPTPLNRRSVKIRAVVLRRRALASGEVVHDSRIHGFHGTVVRGHGAALEPDVVEAGEGHETALRGWVLDDPLRVDAA